MSEISMDTKYLVLYVTWIWVCIVVMSVNFYTSSQDSPHGERMLISFSYGVILASGITYIVNDKLEKKCLTV